MSRNGSEFERRRILELTGAAGLGALSGIPSVTASGDTDTHDRQSCYPTKGVEGDPTAEWTFEQAEQIAVTDEKTPPVIEGVEPIAEDLYLWDWWPLRERDGSVACVDGYMVMFVLSSSDDLLPGKRHDVAEIRYFYSRDGINWQLGGKLFDQAAALGNRQWAGSAVIDDETGEVFSFYTAVGRESITRDPSPPAPDLTAEQRLALADNAQIQTSESGVSFTGDWNHEIILTAQGEYYQTQQQAGEGIVYAFRDPWYFEDPNTGCQYLIFEANTPVDPSETPCESVEFEEGDYLSGVPAGSANFNGNVGFAVSTADMDMSEWVLRPPLLDAVCVNQQLERGNIVTMNDRYYLFVLSHKFTFAPELDGPDGLYGFVADSVHGDYQPLNEGGLVIGNPQEAPFQAYSWMPVPYDENRLAVISYYNYHDLGGRTLTGVADLPPEEQRDRFGGTPAPTVIISVEGDQTEIVDVREPGFLPSTCSDPSLPGGNGGTANTTETGTDSA